MMTERGFQAFIDCPSSTFDPHTPDGGSVEIEQRDPAEVRGSHGADVPTLNPAFDVTPNQLVTGIITERGIFAPQALLSELSQ